MIIATKLDKLKRSQVAKQLKILKQSMELEKGTVVIPFSAVTKQGRDEIWQLMEERVLEWPSEETVE